MIKLNYVTITILLSMILSIIAGWFLVYELDKADPFLMACAYCAVAVIFLPIEEDEKEEGGKEDGTEKKTGT